MNAVLEPDVKKYIRRSPRRFFYDEEGNPIERKISYVTFLRAIKKQSISIESAYAALEILDVPEEERQRMVNLAWEQGGGS